MAGPDGPSGIEHGTGLIESATEVDHGVGPFDASLEIRAVEVVIMQDDDPVDAVDPAQGGGHTPAERIGGTAEDHGRHGPTMPT